MAQVHSKTDGRLDWDRLASGGSKSKLGKLRTAWRQHLGIETDEQLRTVLRPLRILQGRTLKELGDALNDRLYRAGLVTVEEGCLCNPYDDLARRLIQSKKTEYARFDIEAICKRENLWMGHSIPEPETYRVGIRSFLRWAENLEDETDVMLDLLRYFNGRSIRSPELWLSQIYPAVDSFLSSNLRPGQKCYLHLHAHASIAFAAGYCLNSKSGVDVAVIQSTRVGREIWRPSTPLNPEGYETLIFNETLLLEDETDVALALSITHHLNTDVQTYISQENIPVRRIIFCALGQGTSSQAVFGATHAKLLAEQLSSYIKSNRTIRERQGKLHIFASAPNALIFFIGQLSRSFGSCTFYEYDFDSNIPGAYQPSLMFSPPALPKQQ